MDCTEMKHRSSTEIMDSMLRSIKSGATKTRIMYSAYMSYSQLKSYLELLEQNKLIVYDKELHNYGVTEKGRKFMDAYDEIRELVPSAEERGEKIHQFAVQQSI